MPSHKPLTAPTVRLQREFYIVNTQKSIALLKESSSLLQRSKLRPDLQTALTLIGAAQTALEVATTFDEKRNITNKLESFKLYFQRSRAEFSAVQALAVQWLKGLGAMGQWLEDHVEHKGGRPGKNRRSRATVSPEGVSRSQSQKLQRIAKIVPRLDTWAAELDDIPSLRAALRLWLELSGRNSARIPALPDGIYNLIYADPPWRYEHVETENRAIENQYPTMLLEEICALPVSVIAADDCILMLWATNPKLEEAMRVIEAWEFTYRTNMVWVKDKIGMGYYARQRHELLLIAKRGNPPVPAESDRPDSVQEFPRNEHSQKPEEFYEIVEHMYPDRTKIELFCRKPREGWKAWGNEIQK